MDRVAYKPLSDGTKGNHEKEEQQYLSDGEDEQDQIHDDEYFYHQPYYRLNWLLPNYCSSNLLELKQLRNLLYTLAILLTLIFLALLSFRDSPSSSSPSKSSSFVPILHRNEPAKAAALRMPPDIPTDELKLQESRLSSVDIIDPKLKSETRPQYNDYMSSIVGIRESNELGADDLHLKSIESNLNTEIKTNGTNSIWWAFHLRSNYVTVTDYIRANKSFNYNSSLTLTTQATIEFLYHTLELCKRWDGPISLAVYVPGNELLVATTLIKYMRQCLPMPLSACIRDKITWHFVYNKAHGPVPSSLGHPKKHLDLENFPLFVEQDQCPKLAGPNAEDLIKQFEEELRKRNGLLVSNYRQQFKLTYPINVLRNTARLAANTKYVLASDIELYPSINLVPSFINYITKHNISQEYNYIDKFIFTLPIFEVKPTKSAPKTKGELVQMIQQGDAIFFHKWVCDACQAFPNRLSWLQTDKYGLENMHEQDTTYGEISIFEVTQRDKEKSSWEPIFIGTNEDPLYDDRLTWEGRRDKMGQMFEMCLQNYYLLVIGNAFLVHAPGIKHIDKKDVARRYDFMRENNLIYDATMGGLRKQYANSSNIDKC